MLSRVVLLQVLALGEVLALGSSSLGGLHAGRQVAPACTTDGPISARRIHLRTGLADCLSHGLAVRLQLRGGWEGTDADDNGGDSYSEDFPTLGAAAARAQAGKGGGSSEEGEEQGWSAAGDDADELSDAGTKGNMKVESGWDMKQGEGLGLWR